MGKYMRASEIGALNRRRDSRNAVLFALGLGTIGVLAYNHLDLGSMNRYENEARKIEFLVNASRNLENNSNQVSLSNTENPINCNNLVYNLDLGNETFTLKYNPDSNDVSVSSNLRPNVDNHAPAEFLDPKFKNNFDKKQREGLESFIQEAGECNSQ